MIEIDMEELTGEFAENKDIARKIRLEMIGPEIKKGNEVALDFEGVSSMTQSFAHALLSELIRTYGGEIFDVIVFKNCSESVRMVIEMVADYMEESMK